MNPDAIALAACLAALMACWRLLLAARPPRRARKLAVQFHLPPELLEHGPRSPAPREYFKLMAERMARRAQAEIERSFLAGCNPSLCKERTHEDDV